jgi:hypothetical protein
MKKNMVAAFILAVLCFTALGVTAEETALIPPTHRIFENREPAWISDFQSAFRSLFSESTVSAHSLALMLRLSVGHPWPPDPHEAAGAFFEILEMADLALKRGAPSSRVFVEMQTVLSLGAGTRYRKDYSKLLGERRRTRGDGPVPDPGGAFDLPRQRKNERRP